MDRFKLQLEIENNNLRDFQVKKKVDLIKKSKAGELGNATPKRNSTNLQMMGEEQGNKNI